MKSYFAALLCLTLCFFANGKTRADRALLKATYAAEHSGINITLVRNLSIRENNTFVYALKGSGKLIKIEEESTFLRDNGDLKPLDYTYRRRVFGIGRTEHLNFDWDKKEASYKKGRSKPVVHALTPGLLDSALYPLQLQKQLYLGQKDTLTVHYIQKDRVKTREFSIDRETEFTLKDITHKALVIKRLNEKNGKMTEITVLPTMFYQIAEIKQTQNDGGVYETRLIDLSYDEALMAKFYSEGKM